MLSDGRIQNVPLVKTSCLSCGLASHAIHSGANEVREIFNSDFTLGTIASIFDVARAERYASAIAELGVAARAGRVLEVGCGAGLVLRELAMIWPEAAFVGLEAAPRLARRVADPRILIRQEFLEDMPTDKSGFDLIFAINVLEHAADSRRFLQSMARQISRNGRAILICPDAMRPNLELLFSDHVHSFTPNALANFALGSGLDLIIGEEGRPRFEDFRIYVLSPHGQEVAAAPIPHRIYFRKLHRLRSDYLSHWSRIDDLLSEQSRKAHEVFVFGAGEAAALLRAYAPQLWSRVEALVVDQPPLPNWLDKQVVATDSLRPSPQRTLVLAVHPRSQGRIAARLTAEGFNVIRWDQVIAR
jgi:SAM-dependent methyltransferase